MKTTALVTMLVALLIAATAFADDGGASIDQAKMDAGYAKLHALQAPASQPAEDDLSPNQRRIRDLSDQIQKLAAQNQQLSATVLENSRQIDSMKTKLLQFQQELDASTAEAQPVAMGTGVVAPADAALQAKISRELQPAQPETRAVGIGEVRGSVHPTALTPDSVGVTVDLLRATVPRAAIIDCLSANMTHLDQLADHEDKLIEDIKDSLPDYARDHALKAKQFRELSNRAHDAIMNTEGDLSTLSAFALVRDTSYPVPSFARAVTAASIAQTKTDAAGNYSFVNLADGVYYVHARYETTSNFVEWVIPVQIKGGGVDMALTLDNASVNKQN